VTPRVENGLNPLVYIVAAVLAVVGIVLAYLIWDRSP